LSDGLSILFAGDVYFNGAPASLCPELFQIASKADLVAINLEGPVTDKGCPYSRKAIHLRNEPAGMGILKSLSVDVACLANNHICDWGQEGLTDTIRILDESGIAHVGAGVNSRQAAEPVIVNRGGVSVGFLAYGCTDIGTVPAGEDSFGAAWLCAETMCRQISQLKDSVDVVVVATHWDSLNYHYPMSQTVSLGRSLIQAGATLVIGHHPHVIQGYEYYRDGVIVYSLGDLVFAENPQATPSMLFSSENQNGLIVKTNISTSGLEKLEFLHIIQKRQEGRVEVCLNDDASRTRFLEHLSQPFSKSSYSRFFKWYTTRRLIRRGISWLNPKRWKNIKKGHFVGLYLALRQILLGRR